MSYRERDPLPPVNGELASVHDILMMEALALSLLDPQPVEVHKACGILLESGRGVIVRTDWEELAGESSPSSASIQFMAEDGEVVYVSGFKPDNEESETRFYDEHVAHIMSIMQDLIEDDRSAGLLRDIIRHFQHRMFAVSGWDEFTAVAGVSSATTNSIPLAEAMRRFVDNKTDVSVRIREYQLADEDVPERVLEIVEHVRDGLGDESEYDELPKLQIEFKDLTDDQAHCYTAYADGDSELVAYQPSQDQDEDWDVEPTEEDMEVDEFMEQMGFAAPSRDDVRMLTRQLNRCVDYEASVAGNKPQAD